MTHQDLTPDFVRELLAGLISKKNPFVHTRNALIAASPVIASAYLQLSEKCARLESDYDKLMKVHVKVGIPLMNENMRLRAALEFYANEDNWETFDVGSSGVASSLIYDDFPGEIAEKALAGAPPASTESTNAQNDEKSTNTDNK